MSVPTTPRLPPPPALPPPSPTPPDGPASPFSPLTNLLKSSRKGVLTQNVLAMTTVFAIGLTVAAFCKVLSWEAAFRLGALALVVFGGQSATHTVSIGIEDAAKFKAAAPAALTKIDASSSATQVATQPSDPSDPDITIDPSSPSSHGPS